MIENGIIITAIIGIASNFATGFTTWFFARKRYNSEVDNNLIKNMQDSLEFYKKLSDDNRSRLEEVLKRNENLEEEVKQLRQQVMNLMSNMYTDLSDKVRREGYENVL